MTPEAQSIRAGPAPLHLEELLGELIGAHERLLALAREHRAALSRADSAAIAACIRAQNEAVQGVAAIEARRMAVVTSMADLAGAPPTLSSIIARLPAGARDRLTALGERLRSLLTTLHREQEVLRTAAEALAAHMDGLMRQIGRRLSHTGTYERPSHGATAAHPGHTQVLTALDMTT